MKKKNLWVLKGLSVLIVAAIVLGGILYFFSVQNSLWMLSVTDLKQVTVQASHALDTYFQKDVQNVHVLAVDMEKVNSDDVEYIKSRLEIYNAAAGDESFYTVVDMGREAFYLAQEDGLYLPVPEDRLEVYRNLEGSGIEEPFLGEVNGVRSLACYECFTFADGVQGIVRRVIPASGIVEEFFWSVYDGSGFSYIVNREGNILLRSIHRNSSHTYQNIFDAMALETKEPDETGEESVIDGLRRAMSEGKSGVVRFSAVEKEEYIYAYVPISNTDGWYYVSGVPSSVLMEQGSHILNISQLFLFVIALALLVAGLVVLSARKNRRAMEKIEQEVRYREQLFDILTNSTGDAFIMFTVENRLVEYVSPNIEYLLGIPAKELKENFFLLQEQESTDSDFAQKLAALQAGESFLVEQERVHRGTGEHRWFTFTVYRVVVETVDKVILVLSDRTAEKQKENMLEESMNIAEAANRAKSSFLSNMSHDIRTPMNAIVGLCTLLERDAEKPELVREHIRKISASSRHLLGLINDVLDMSKIEAGKTTLNISDISLAEIVEELLTVLMPQAKAKQQIFEISVSDVKSEHLLGDKLRINQILMNILSNAIKYTPTGGRVEMLIRQMPQTTPNYASIRFVVQDNGIGMSPEYLETIFQPFTREINSATNKVQGTGLGMTITKSLTDLMGGVISVESEPGKGTTFTVELELRIREQEADRDFWKDHGISEILVIDDDEDVCRRIVDIMEETGVLLQCAYSGEDAVAMAERGQQQGKGADIILLDWKMPQMSGMETARRIRKIIPGSTPILVFSAYDWSDIEQEALSVGINGFVPKPFFLSSFEQAVEKLHKEEDAGDPTAAGQLSGTHILAAEDNELNAEILLELLDMMGAVCVVEEDGKKALERFCASAPGTYDIILMDIQMPVMNGYEATRAIRGSGHPQAADIPIIAMTADAFAEDMQKALDAGMNGHMAKPLDLNRLAETVREVLRKTE